MSIRNKVVNNTWTVPYNPYLCLKYNCHINVEICTLINRVKYLFKYVYKGHSCANIQISEKILSIITKYRTSLTPGM